MQDVAHLLTERMNVAHKKIRLFFRDLGGRINEGGQVGRIGWRYGGVE